MSQFTGKSGFELKTFILFYFLNSFYFLQPLQCPQGSVRRQSTFYFSTFCFSFWASPPYPWWLEGPFKSIGFIEVIFISHWLNCNLWNKSTGLQIFHFSFLLRKTYTDSINMQPETMIAWLSEGKDLKSHLVCPFYFRGRQREVKKRHVICLKFHILRAADPPRSPSRENHFSSQRAGWMNRSIWVRNAKRGLLWRLHGKESVCQCRKYGFDPWSGKIPHATEQLSSYTTTIELELWSPGTTATEAHVPRACALQQEKPLQREAPTLQLESSPYSPQLEKSLHSNEDPTQSIIKLRNAKKKQPTTAKLMRQHRSPPIQE